MGKQQTHVPEADYVSMENGAPRSAYAYYVVPVEPRKRRQCGGCCCFLCLATFLLCFFLIPRTPTVWLKNLTVNTDTEGAVGTFHLRAGVRDAGQDLPGTEVLAQYDRE